MTARAAERKLRLGFEALRVFSSVMSVPSAVVVSHETFFCPAALNLLAAITALAARQGLVHIHTLTRILCVCSHFGCKRPVTFESEQRGFSFKKVRVEREREI